MGDKQVAISVVMGVYNQWDRKALQDAVRSILTQTFTDFEFIIYDDGSHPEAAQYIKELETFDNRIILIGKEENHGLAFSLNACIRKAKGKYIARMDADDMSLPTRLQEQFDFLETHPEYGWCGTNTKLFDENGVWGERKMPECPTEKDYLKYSPYVHPTVMYRRTIFEENDAYKVSDETLRCEDYEIFMRLRRAGNKGYNIQKNLFCYRENKESFSKRKFKYRINEAKLRYRNFKAMGMLFPTGWLYVLRPIVGGILPNKLLKFLKRLEAKLRKS